MARAAWAPASSPSKLPGNAHVACHSPCGGTVYQLAVLQARLAASLLNTGLVRSDC